MVTPLQGGPWPRAKGAYAQGRVEVPSLTEAGPWHLLLVAWHYPSGFLRVGYEMQLHLFAASCGTDARCSLQNHTSPPRLSALMPSSRALLSIKCGS